jgi:hypothetical protein
LAVKISALNCRSYDSVAASAGIWIGFLLDPEVGGEIFLNYTTIQPRTPNCSTKYKLYNLEFVRTNTTLRVSGSLGLLYKHPVIYRGPE